MFDARRGRYAEETDFNRTSDASQKKVRRFEEKEKKRKARERVTADQPKTPI